jgi:hypothetical protein
VSFYLGLLEKGRGIAVSDRAISDGLEIVDDSKPRCVAINPSTYFIPAGDLWMGRIIEALLKELFGKEAIDLKKVSVLEKQFSEQMTFCYTLVRPYGLAYLKHQGADSTFERSDNLLIGISSDGQPFLVNITDENKFALDIYTEAGTVLLIPPEVKEVREWLDGKIRHVFRERDFSEKNLLITGKEILGCVSKHDRFVSLEGDLVVADRDGVRVVEV